MSNCTWLNIPLPDDHCCPHYNRFSYYSTKIKSSVNFLIRYYKKIATSIKKTILFFRAIDGRGEVVSQIFCNSWCLTSLARSIQGTTFSRFLTDDTVHWILAAGPIIHVYFIHDKIAIITFQEMKIRHNIKTKKIILWHLTLTHRQF